MGRKRFDETLIQLEELTGHTFITCAIRVPLDSPYAREYADEQLDRTMSQALIDLVQRYWIPVPPILERVFRRVEPFLFMESEIRERRIRVIKPRITAIAQSDSPVLSVDFSVDWPAMPDWNTYVPEYDDGKVDEAKDRPAGPKGKGEDRARPGADAPPSLPAG
ncbi:MAG TPA: hypothetical protein VFP22_00555 [Candidatus Limnocylindrales bacterium]|nr:hypothetical protein [Candidatus Limnocylindrales bacterium]